MSPIDLASLLLLSAMWGGSFLFMRIAAPAFGPVLLVELRVLIAGLCLLVYGSLARKLPPFRAAWKVYLLIGFLNAALPFVLISAAELHLPASLAATLNATTPLFGALMAALVLKERLTVRRGGGLLVGFSGVAVLVGLGAVSFSPVIALSILASLLAAACYGVAVVLIKQTSDQTTPLALTTFSQLGAALLLLPLVPATLPRSLPGLPAVLCLLALSLLSTAVANLLYFRLINRLGPTRATLVTYISPAFGILWGALFLHEPLGIGTFAGFALILASTGLVNGKARVAGASKEPLLAQ